MIYIYTLTDPRTHEVRYVGKTNNVSKRFKEHVRTSKGKQTWCARWIATLLLDGVKPIITVIAILEDGTDWGVEEKNWISCFKATGSNLCNIQEGGGGNPPLIRKKRNKMSPEHRAKLEAAGFFDGKKRTAETTEKINKTMAAKRAAGWRLSDASLAVISQSNIGKHFASAETREKMRVAHLGQRRSRESLLKQSDTQRGRKMSDEARAKMSKARMGWDPSKETRKKMSLAKLGKKLTPEQLQKHRDNWTKIKAERRLLKAATNN